MQDKVYEKYSEMLFHDLEMIVEHGPAWNQYLLTSADFNIFSNSDSYEFLTKVAMHPLVPVSFLEKTFDLFPNFEPGLVVTMIENKRFTVESLLMIVRRADHLTWYQLVRFNLFADDEVYKDIVWRAMDVHFRKNLVHRWPNFLSPWMIAEAYMQYGYDDEYFISEAFPNEIVSEGEALLKQFLIDYAVSVFGVSQNWGQLPQEWLVELLLPSIRKPYFNADSVLQSG